jgi:hypothetical protein
MKMTLDAVLEKYGNCRMVFTHYHKYVFYYKSIDEEGLDIRVACTDDDIYRSEFDAEDTLAGLELVAELLYVKVDGKTLYIGGSDEMD